MSEEMAFYRELEWRLWTERWKNEGRESVEEDAVLDDMDDAWRGLTKDEKDLLNLEGPTCWPMDPDSKAPSLMYPVGRAVPRSESYEGFRSPAEAIQEAA